MSSKNAFLLFVEINLEKCLRMEHTNWKENLIKYRAKNVSTLEILHGYRGFASFLIESNWVDYATEFFFAQAITVCLDRAKSQRVRNYNILFRFEAFLPPNAHNHIADELMIERV